MISSVLLRIRIFIHSGQFDSIFSDQIGKQRTAYKSIPWPDSLLVVAALHFTERSEIESVAAPSGPD